MKFSAHVTRVILLMVAASFYLTWKANHASIVFADSLRYIHQAQQFDGGDIVRALFHAIDHPAYPVAIALAHRMLGGTTPESWQVAAQAASVVAAVLMVIPLYLVAAEMFGGASAMLAVVLAYLVPITGQVMGDALSESLFLLSFWWGVWAAIRFLRSGTFAWLPAAVAFAALAFWVRPEALLLPAALVATLAAIPLLRATRMDWSRWWAAVAFLVIGPGLLIAPILASKGGLSTKPAVGRLLGTAKPSAASAVERQRPLDPNQTTAQLYVQATRAMAMSVRDSVTVPLLPLALAGLIFAWPPGEKSRMWVFLSIVMVAWALAMIRLFATGGYCTPRHALILAYPLIMAAASGLRHLLAMVVIPGAALGQPGERFRLGPIGVLLAVALLGLIYKAENETPINERFAGYRDAAVYLAQHVPPGEKVVDVTGWALFYGERPGYTFATLVEALGDRNLKCLVVRDAHLNGPWEYCAWMKRIIGDRKPVAQYPEHPVDKKQSIVFVYDWSAERQAQAPAPAVVK